MFPRARLLRRGLMITSHKSQHFSHITAFHNIGTRRALIHSSNDGKLCGAGDATALRGLGDAMGQVCFVCDANNVGPDHKCVELRDRHGVLKPVRRLDPVWDTLDGARARLLAVEHDGMLQLGDNDGRPLPDLRHASQVLAY